MSSVVNGLYFAHSSRRSLVVLRYPQHPVVSTNSFSSDVKAKKTSLSIEANLLEEGGRCIGPMSQAICGVTLLRLLPLHACGT